MRERIGWGDELGDEGQKVRMVEGVKFPLSQR